MIPFLFKKTDSDDPDVVKGYESTYSYVMRFCGLYPDFKDFRYYIFGFHQNCIHVAYLWFVIAYMISTYLAATHNDIELLSYELCYGLLTLIFFLVAHNIMYRRHQLDSLFRMVGKGFFTYEKPVDSKEQSVVDDCDKRCKKTFRRNLLLSLVLTLLICVIPPLPHALKGEYTSVVEGGVPVNKHLALPVWSPYPIDTPLTFWTMYTIELLAGNVESFILGANCTLFCNLCIIISRELKLLRIALKNTKSRAIHTFKMKGHSLSRGERYEKSEIFQQCMVQCINECIEHHVVLKKFNNAIQDMMGFPIFAIFSGTALTISSPMFMLLTMSRGHDTLFLVLKVIQHCYIIFSFTFFLSSYCVFGQLITNESSSVHFAFYETPWLEANLDFRRKVLMGMIHSRKPFVLTAKGFASASSATLIDILKTIFSYFNLLAATQ